MYDYDLIVIGGGSGGVRAARMAAAQYGKRVALIERDRLGGTCVNVGCIPKKLFHCAAHYAESFHEARGFGWTTSDIQFNWLTLVQNVQMEISRLNSVYAGLLQQAGVTVMTGNGQLQDAHTVRVGDRSVTAERILLAVGGAPWMPDIPGAEHTINSNDFFSLSEMPASVAVIGGGYIAVELAGILNALGCATVLLHRGDSVLRGFDDDIRQHLLSEMQKKGVQTRLNANVSRVKHAGSIKTVVLENGQTIDVDCVLYATGRKPVTSGLGLENTSIKLSKSGHIEVNKHFQTHQASIYALGDAVGNRELTPVALAEAAWLLDQWYGDGLQTPVDYERVASAVFSQPEIGTVGLSEQSAINLYGDDVQIYKSEFRALRHTVSGSKERTLMKVVVQTSTNRVLGLHMVGPVSGEIIQGFAVALTLGVTKKQLDSTVGIHPTAAEEFVTMRTPVS
jgi:glutathione reductase (NADPH)